MIRRKKQREEILKPLPKTARSKNQQMMSRGLIRRRGTQMGMKKRSTKAAKKKRKKREQKMISMPKTKRRKNRKR